jgi:hypothetical protein
MFLYVFYKRYLWLLRAIFLSVMGLLVAFGIALHQVNLESLRGNILSVLRDSTNMPVEIDGKISWKFSLRPQIELNNVRIPNADWAKQKNLFSAERIDVRLDLFSLFSSKPVLRYVRVHNAKIMLEKNESGENSVVYNKSETSGNQPDTAQSNIKKYPFESLPFSGLTVQNISANIYGDKYTVKSFSVRNHMGKSKMEYSGWVNPGNLNLPFVIKFSEYNSDRKIYPVQIAFSTGAEALIADIALEGTSKAPIDFIVRGDILDIRQTGKWFNVDILKLPKIKVNIVGGFDRRKISFRKSSVTVGDSVLSFSGTYDWSKNIPVINAKVSSNYVDIYKSFPEWFGAGQSWVHPKRELNVFKDMPLFGKYLYGVTANIELSLKQFIPYRALALSDLIIKANVENHKLRADANLKMASGDMLVGLDADIDENGVYTVKAAADCDHLYIGEILKQVNVHKIISGLPVNIDFYLEARGADMSQIMKTITGPVIMYSVDKGYAHADLVEYMYGGDFLTSLRQNVEDLFSGDNKHDMIEISGAIANVKLRKGLIETQNGVAVETKAINVRLAGTLDLGKEKIQMSVATVPVRGLKISLSGNLVNALQISGNLAEPDFKISGGAIVGKVGSAVGLGLLLAPLTGGLSIAGGFVAGLLAGDLLENWLADDHPYKTAKKKGAPLKRGDPDWFNKPIASLQNLVLGK